MSLILRMCVAMVVVAIPTSRGLAQDDPKKPNEPPLNELSMEANSLQAIYQFKLTPAQMEKMQQWAKETAQAERKREPGRATKEYRDKLQDLRDALVAANDSDLIDQTNEQLNDLREAEEPTIDDGADVTDAARKRAPELFQLLKASQLAAYIAQVAEGVPDPLDRLLEAFETVRELKGNAWREKRDEIAEEVSRLIVGLDPDKSDSFNDQVTALLIRVRGLNSDEYQKQYAELEKAARRIVGDVSPAQVLRHYVEYELATLLSNPRLSAALDARLK